MSTFHIYLGDGERLDVFLAKNLSGFTRSYIKTLIEKKMITVNGENVKAGYSLKRDDEIEIKKVEKTEPTASPENIPVDIIYEDENLAVINKPYGMVVHPCTTTPEHTLVNALLYKIKDLSGINGVLRPGIVHRLDKDTSGLLCVAKNDMAHKKLSAQLKDKTMYREYYAIVNGVINQDKFEIDKPIGRNKKDRKKMDIIADGRSAQTIVEVLRRYPKLTLVKCNLKTGRTHQIRVHLKSIGHPVVGDVIYGNKNDYKGDHLMLVSKKLSFIHPETNERMTFEIDLPNYFTELINKLN